MNRRMLGIFLIVAGAVTLAAGVAVVVTSEKQQADKQSFGATMPDTAIKLTPEQEPKPAVVTEHEPSENHPETKPKTTEPKAKPVPSDESTTRFDENKRKGDAFEKYVVKRNYYQTGVQWAKNYRTRYYQDYSLSKSNQHDYPAIS